MNDAVIVNGEDVEWSLKGPLLFWLSCWSASRRLNCLLAGGVLGDGLGTFTDGVLGQLTGQEETDGCLDLPRSDGASLVVVGQTAGFGGDTLEDVVHERVHDRHSLGGDASVRVHLLQHLVDVDAVAFLSPALPLLVTGTHGFRLAGLLGAFA